ncbi:MAG: ABC transporter substrate-binding protein [Geminicoccaceae bacterium]
MTRRAVLALLLASAFAVNTGAAAGPDQPQAVVERLQSALLEAMKQAKTLGYEGRYGILAPVLRDTYDFAFVARISAGPFWARWSDMQRQQLTDAVAEMSIATYASRFDGFSGERFETLGEGPGPRDTTVVKTRIVRPNDSPVPLDYVLSPTGDSWRIVDVLLDGKFSELAKQRAEFGAILKNDGLPELLDRLAQRVQQMRQG